MKSIKSLLLISKKCYIMAVPLFIKNTCTYNISNIFTVNTLYKTCFKRLLKEIFLEPSISTEGIFFKQKSL